MAVLSKRLCIRKYRAENTLALKLRPALEKRRCYYGRSTAQRIEATGPLTPSLALFVWLIAQHCSTLGAVRNFAARLDQFRTLQLGDIDGRHLPLLAKWAPLAIGGVISFVGWHCRLERQPGVKSARMSRERMGKVPGISQLGKNRAMNGNQRAG
jgi:hypothetical protein